MSVELWTSTAFLDEAREWVADRLAELGARLTGEWEQPHARSWSSAIRFETTVGRVWFKVNGVGTRHEASLVPTGRRAGPGPGPRGPRRGRGPRLVGQPGRRSRAAGARAARTAVGCVEGIVARYAEAQIALSVHRDAVLATGVAEVTRRPRLRWPGRYGPSWTARPSPRAGCPGSSPCSWRAVLPALDRWCAELASSGVPDSVQHDDLHSANVCWPGDLADARIIDWGDSSWGHPFGTMLATLNSIAFHAGLYVEGEPPRDEAVLRVRDAYLEPFTSYAGRADLVRAVDLARRTGCVAKALSYRAALAGLPVEAQAEQDFPVRDWLLGLLDD